MEVQSAIEMTRSFVFFPGWTLEARDYTHRHEGTIALHVEFPGVATERENAPGYKVKIRPYQDFVIIVRDLDFEGYCRAVLECLHRIFIHESREAFRVRPTMLAPFHPHRVDGQRRWGDVAGDLAYGIA